MLLELISELLLLEEDYILEIADTASKRYKKFYIKKRNGSSRAIYHPSKELKGIQRIIHDELLTGLPSHTESMAYKKGCSIKNHADKHKKSRYLLRLDFKKFFESITENDIRLLADKVIANLKSGWDDADTNLLIKLTTFNGGLTIGSITSPLLSDAICYPLDALLCSMSHELGVTYTRYADDLYFSTNERNILTKIPDRVREILNALEYPANLTINNGKTYHSSKKNKMMVTGLVLTNNSKVSIGHAKKREIRSKVHTWHKLDESQKRHLSGYMSYIKSVEPSFINTLCNKYGADIIKNIISYNSVN